jgi:hypothetical protein
LKSDWVTMQGEEDFELNKIEIRKKNGLENIDRVL